MLVNGTPAGPANKVTSCRQHAASQSGWSDASRVMSSAGVRERGVMSEPLSCKSIARSSSPVARERRSASLVMPAASRTPDNRASSKRIARAMGRRNRTGDGEPHLGRRAATSTSGFLGKM